MKKIIVFMLCAISIAAQSQITVSLDAGINKTFISLTPQNYSSADVSGNYAWQLGIKTKFPVKKNLSFYSGAYYQTNKFESNFLECCFISETDIFNAHFLKIPVGLTYTVHHNKNFNVSILAGGYSLVGLGGSVRKYGAFGDIIYTPFDNTNPIKYGKNSGDDLVKANFGLECGAALQYKKMKFEFVYDFGLTNMLPDYSIFGRPSEYRFRNIQFNLGYIIAPTK
jgi:hypothetical protein